MSKYLYLYVYGLFLGLLLLPPQILAVPIPEDSPPILVGECEPALRSLAPIGKYNAPKVEVPEALLKSVDADFAVIHGKRYERGQTLDLSLMNPDKVSDELPWELSEVFPEVVTGVLLGTSNRDGHRLVCFNLGYGQVIFISVDLILSVGRSSKSIPVSLAKPERQRHWSWSQSVKQLDRIRGFVSTTITPSLGGFFAVYEVFNFATQPLWVLYEHSEAGQFAVLAIASGGILTKTGRALGRFLLGRAYQFGSHLTCFLQVPIFYPDKLPQIFKYFGTRLSEKDIQDLMLKTEASPNRAISDNFRLLEVKDEVRLFAHSLPTGGELGFHGYSLDGFASLLETRKYLESLGIPASRERLDVLVSENGLNFPGGGYPHSDHRNALIYVGSSFNFLEANMAEKHVWLDFWKEPIVYAHEMVHFVLYRWLGEAKMDEGIGRFLNETLADYFAFSALDVADPKLGLRYNNDILPMREAVERKYEGTYPDHLNFNSIARLVADVHKASQVLTRYLWKVRTQVSRSRLDPIVIRATEKINRYRLLSGGPKDSRTMDPSLSNRQLIEEYNRDIYLFISVLIRMERESKNHDPEFEKILFNAADEFQIPREALEAVLQVQDRNQAFRISP